MYQKVLPLHYVFLTSLKIQMHHPADPFAPLLDECHEVSACADHKFSNGSASTHHSLQCHVW